MPVALTLSEPRAAAFGAAVFTVGRHRRVVEAADFYDLDGEGLELVR